MLVFCKYIYHVANTTPSAHFLQIISRIKETVITPLRIAEVGVDRGATTSEVAKLLNEHDIYDLFDLDCTFFRDKENFNGRFKPKLIKHQSTKLIFDSYAWEIAQILKTQSAENAIAPIWDAVYLDGAHTFNVDAPATVCLKELVKVGGYLVLDDMNWTLSGSQTCNTQFMRERFTDEQFKVPHVKLIADLFMRTDKRFTEVDKDLGKDRAIYHRIA